MAVFVVQAGHVVLHRHEKLQVWLPPGGHIEPDELPDEAAIREVEEETGLTIELVGSRGLPRDYDGQPRQLVRPEGIQLEDIGPGHQHIDLVYFARPRDHVSNTLLPGLTAGMQWIRLDELVNLELTEEIIDWCRKAILSFPVRI